MLLMALMELESRVETHQISFLTLDEINIGDRITFYGYSTGELVSGIQKAIEGSEFTPQVLNQANIGQGAAKSGDSGAPVINGAKNIVAVLNEISGIDDEGLGLGSKSSRITYSKDFILNTINGWHYPTLAVTTNGSVTIEVQSLHVASVIDDATPSGDIAIIGGTCWDASIEPFDTCTYELSSDNNEEGTLTLGEGEVITVNKGKTTPPPVPGDDGGSLGWLALLGLIGVRASRQRHIA